jgi:hypothetical protein
MFTETQLEKRSRRLRFLDAKVNAVLLSMQNGCALHLSYANGQSTWLLSDGRYVSPNVARVVVNLPNIVGVGDALPIFGAQSQTWRFANDEEG